MAGSWPGSCPAQAAPAPDWATGVTTPGCVVVANARQREDTSGYLEDTGWTTAVLTNSHVSDQPHTAPQDRVVGSP